MGLGYLDRWNSALQADGSAYTNSTTPTSIINAQAKPVLRAGRLASIGDSFELFAAGRITSPAAPANTLTLSVKFTDSAATAVTVATGGAMTLNASAKTNVPWVLRWWFTVRSVGSGTSCTLMHQGIWISEDVVGSGVPTAGGAGTAMLPNSAPAVGTGFDSTLQNTVDLMATWSGAAATYSITCHQAFLVFHSM